MMLADYLRRTRNLTGTKIVCAEGDCGACSVLRYFPKAGPKFLPINSCITTVAQMDGSSLVTVDALARQSGGEVLTPVQKAMIDCHGSQCGFCTPGFIVAITGLVETKLARKNRGPISTNEAKNALTGNLCRCTGYQPILDATTNLDLTQCESIKSRFVSPAQEKDLKKIFSEPLKIESTRFLFYAPKTLNKAAKFLSKNPEARILGAGTDLGVQQNKGKTLITQALSLHLISELYEIKMLPKNRISVGARVTLTELREFLKSKIPEFARFLDLFASPQIKNVATLVGNLGNASPIGDTLPFLMVSDAAITIQGPSRARMIEVSNFFQGYRKTALKSGEIITSVHFDIPTESDHLSLFKVSERKDLDISAVSAAYRIRGAGRDFRVIRSVQLAMGGVSSTPIRFPKTEKLFINVTVTPELLTRAEIVLQSEINPLSDLRGTGAFRRVLAGNLLKRAFRDWRNGR